MLRNVAHELEDIALRIDERMAGSSEELAQLRQLKALLSTLGGPKA